MDVTLVPFGNARFTNGVLECQHGEDECKANSYEQCAIHLYPKFDQHWPFYLCVEQASLSCGEGGGTCTLGKMESCATSSSLDYSSLEACVNDKPEALKLQQEASAATPSDHEYVPWVLVDGKLSSDKKTLLEEVCQKYKGTKPAACSKVGAPLATNASSCSATWQ